VDSRHILHCIRRANGGDELMNNDDPLGLKNAIESLAHPTLEDEAKIVVRQWKMTPGPNESTGR